MGPWWANDAWFWWELFAIFGAVIAAIVAIIIIAKVGNDSTT